MRPLEAPPQLDFLGIVSPEQLQTYADAIADYGLPCHSIIGFIDCMICKTCQPSFHQEFSYTGYKQIHGLKFQCVITKWSHQDLAGPFMAPQNDNGILVESHLLEKMACYAIQPGSSENDPPDMHFFQIYKDSAYRVSPQVLSPFTCIGELLKDEHAWNAAMGLGCIC